MPQLKRESVTTGDQSWVGSGHGIHNCRTSVLDVSAFTKADHYPDGYFPSGLIVNVADESSVKPFTGATGEVFGVLFTDQTTDGVEDLNVPIFRHGFIKVDRLPVTTNIPDDAPNGFVFIQESDA
ncbi:hypothetical protein [Aeromicrobium piscarium]|uniref:Head decoration protein n=1 Tax=Aeromicrobium piscarium TaxID=2590901 RepID=A0A554SP42_9ACTN|nr:hypothetical protein [Aeromicrobium piscarium]TSD68126.1 hypothetical protein FNM00_00580 [Aeromicrobium piscarium]